MSIKQKFGVKEFRASFDITEENVTSVRGCSLSDLSQASPQDIIEFLDFF